MKAYCLQEVGEETRPVIESLKEQGFKIVHYEGQEYFDAAIALDENRFQEIVNHSMNVDINGMYKKDVAIATAIDTLSGQRVTFVSAHVPGFNFANMNPEEIADGDLYCQAIAKKLSEIAQGTIQVIGADMNANPEKLKQRFEIFSNKGFQLHRTNACTNVNPNEPEYQERELDFVFTKMPKSSFWQKIKSIFRSTIRFEASLGKVNPIDFDETKNCSDHLPVFVETTSRIKMSKVRQFWNITGRLLALCCTCTKAKSTGAVPKFS